MSVSVGFEALEAPPAFLAVFGTLSISIGDVSNDTEDIRLEGAEPRSEPDSSSADFVFTVSIPITKGFDCGVGCIGFTAASIVDGVVHFLR
jgi:hypothetical protein